MTTASRRRPWAPALALAALLAASPAVPQAKEGGPPPLELDALRCAILASQVAGKPLDVPALAMFSPQVRGAPDEFSRHREAERLRPWIRSEADRVREATAFTITLDPSDPGARIEAYDFRWMAYPVVLPKTSLSYVEPGESTWFDEGYVSETGIPGYGACTVTWGRRWDRFLWRLPQAEAERLLPSIEAEFENHPGEAPFQRHVRIRLTLVREHDSAPSDHVASLRPSRIAFLAKGAVIGEVVFPDPPPPPPPPAKSKAPPPRKEPRGERPRPEPKPTILAE